MPYALSDKTAARLTEVLQRTDGEHGGTATPGYVPHQSSWVRVNSQCPSAATTLYDGPTGSYNVPGWYDCNVSEIDGNGHWVDYVESCRVKEANGTVLMRGRRYLARRTGDSVDVSANSIVSFVTAAEPIMVQVYVGSSTKVAGTIYYGGSYGFWRSEYIFPYGNREYHGTCYVLNADGYLLGPGPYYTGVLSPCISLDGGTTSFPVVVINGITSVGCGFEVDVSVDYGRFLKIRTGAGITCDSAGIEANCHDCTVSFNCVSGYCVSQAGTGGTYSTLALCQQSPCVPPPPPPPPPIGTTSYNCTDGNCVSVTGSGGTYSTLSACQASCNSGPGYRCVDNTCTYFTTGGGAASLYLCQQSGCGVSFNCVNGQCTSVSGSGGAYATLAACQAANCGSGFNCVSGVCTAVSSGATFTTLAACQSLCGNTYNCDGFRHCVAAGSNGSYQSLAACESSTCRNGYNCVQYTPAGGSTTYTCTAVSSDGTYGTLSECQSSCGTSYNCTIQGCVATAGSGGTYATLAACQAAGCPGGSFSTFTGMGMASFDSTGMAYDVPTEQGGFLDAMPDAVLSEPVIDPVAEAVVCVPCGKKASVLSPVRPLAPVRRDSLKM